MTIQDKIGASECKRQSLIVQFWAFWTVQGVGCGKRIEMFPFTVF